MPLKSLKIRMSMTQKTKIYNSRTNKSRSIDSCYKNSKKRNKITITKMVLINVLKRLELLEVSLCLLPNSEIALFHQFKSKLIPIINKTASTN